MVGFEIYYHGYESMYMYMKYIYMKKLFWFWPIAAVKYGQNSFFWDRVGYSLSKFGRGIPMGGEVQAY